MLAQYCQLRRKSAESGGLPSSDFILAIAVCRLASRLAPSVPLTKSCQRMRTWGAAGCPPAGGVAGAPVWAPASEAAKKAAASRRYVLANLSVPMALSFRRNDCFRGFHANSSTAGCEPHPPLTRSIDRGRLRHRDQQAEADDRRGAGQDQGIVRRREAEVPHEGPREEGEQGAHHHPPATDPVDGVPVLLG